MVNKLMDARWLRLSALIFVIILSTLALGGTLWLRLKNSVAPTTYNGPVESIRIGLIGEYASLVLIAEDQGYFKANGLEVTIEEYPSGPASLDALWAGKLDMAMASDFAGVTASLNGKDIKILATMSKSEAFLMVARKNHGISEIAHLKGKKIGITKGTVGEFFLGQFLSFNSLSQSDIQIIDMPQAQLVDAVDSSRLDAAVLFEPNAYKAGLRLGDQTVRWPVQSGQAINSLLYGTSRLSRERPAALKRYLKAIVQAEHFIKNNDLEAREIIARRLNYDDSYINYIWPKFQFEVSLEQELLITMDDQARWAVENHLAEAATLPNYLDLIHFESLEAVKPGGVTVIR